MLGPYLDRLVDLRLVERRLPITDDPNAPSRRGLYVLADHYLNFWYRFVDANQSYLALGLQDRVLHEKILPQLDAYVSKPGFEAACAQFLWRAPANGRLPLTFTQLGGWWNNQDEIDLVASDGRHLVLVGECKWTRDWVKLGDLFELQRKAAVWLKAPPDVRYALFSRSGFDPHLQAYAEHQGVLLYEVGQLYE